MLHPPSVQRILEEANKWLHVREIGNNRSFNDPEFEKLMKEVGWRPGYAWCVLFCKAVWWSVYRGTEHEKAVLNVLQPGGQLSWRKAKIHPYVMARQQPVVGGVTIMKTGQTTSHAWIATEILDEFRMRSIEGNTNSAGSREGDAVETKIRRISGKVSSRWQYLGSIYPPDYKEYTDGNIATDDLLASSE